MVERKLFNMLKDCCISTILLIARMFLKGIVLMLLWNWFVFSIFSIHITILQSTGLIIISMFFIPSKERYRLDDKKQMWKYFYDDIINSSAYLLLGFFLSFLF